jgi:hypothetical protein
MSFPTAFPSAFGSGGVCPPDSQFGELLVMPITGRTSGTPTNGTVVFSATTDVDVWTTGQAVIVSETRAADDVFRVHTVEISCPNNASGFFVIGDAYKIRSLGNHRGALSPNTEFYAGVSATKPILTLNLNSLPAQLQKFVKGLNSGAAFVTSGNQPLPAGLTYLSFIGTSLAWTYTGALPAGLTFLFMSNSAISWTYNGALPTGLTYLWLENNGLNWTWSGALPENLGTTLLSSSAVNWTGTLVGKASAPFVNAADFRLLNFRNPNSTVTPTELITLLQGLVNRVGTLPSSPAVTIAEYDLSVPIATIQSATPDIAGTTAEQIRYWIDEVKIKSTNFTLNTTAM